MGGVRGRVAAIREEAFTAASDAPHLGYDGRLLFFYMVDRKHITKEEFSIGIAWGRNWFQQLLGNRSGEVPMIGRYTVFSAGLACS